MADRVLNAADLASACWQKLNEHYTERLKKLRAQNDHDCSAEETAKTRGQIREVKLILALAETPPTPQPFDHAQ